MKTNEIIAGLRNCVTTQFAGCKECPAYCRSASCLNRLHTAAADTLEAQQKRIEELEAELSSAVHDLGLASECWSCKRNNKCHPNFPVSGPDVCCGSYKWRGATDTNVGGKEVDAKPLTAFLSPIDAYKGLKRKYLVFKSDTGEMVENCFVLRPDKDPAAVEALRAYARATDNATLSADIVNWVGEGEERRWIPVTERLPKPFESVLAYIPSEAPLPTVHESYIADHDEWVCILTVERYKPGEVTHWMPMPVKEG